MGFLGDALVNNPPPNARDAGDAGSIPRSGRTPGKRNGYLIQCSCLDNSMDRGAWRLKVHGVAKIQT